MNIYFYEIYSSNYNRYVNPICGYLIEKHPGVKLFYIHDNYDHGEITANSELNEHLTLIKKGEVAASLKENPADAFVNFCFRIPDFYWTHYFKKKGIPTFQVQHGLYIDFYNRNLTSVLQHLSRMLSYLVYLSQLILKAKSKFATLSSILKKDVKVMKATGNLDRNILSDHVIIWGEYWKEWFKDTFAFDDSTGFHICGSFDYQILSDPKNVFTPDSPHSATYVCQTLVEDGRLELKDFEEFIQQLATFADGYEGQLYLKMHPRSDKSLYDTLDAKDNVHITNQFPISDVYLGHYSTLLSICPYLKKELLLIELPGHPIPPLFAQLSNHVIQHTDSISIENLSSSEEVETEYYSAYVKNSYEKIADIVLANTK